MDVYALDALFLGVNKNVGLRMICGSCLCGEVKYKISGEVGDISHCHCTTCRKAHGSAFSSVAAVSDDDFILRNKAALSSFESSPGKKRFFCAACGSHIYAKREGSGHVILRLGSLDDDPKAEEKNHIWVSQKASWYSLGQALPEYEEHEVNRDSGD